MTTAQSNATGADTIPPQTPEQYLAAADRAFAAGNHDDGSELLYQSVVSALSQLAQAYSQPCETKAELKAFAAWLDEKHGSADGSHARSFRTAESFHHNAQYRFFHPDDVDFIKPAVWDFVATLSSYRQKAARYG